MKAGTIRLISALLRDEVERRQRRAERANDEWRQADEAAGNAPGTQNDADDLQTVLELTRERKNRAARELAQAKNALEDFEGHEWG